MTTKNNLDGDRLDRLVAGTLKGSINRRALLARGLALGIALPAFAGLLSACEEDEVDDSDPALDPEDDDSDPALDPEDDDADVETDDAVAVDDAEADDTTDDAEADEEPDEDPGETDAGMIRAPEPDPVRGGRLRVIGPAATTNYDIYQGGSGTPLHHIYNRLMRVSPDDGQTIIPELAVDWDVSEDGTEYTFHLREGVEFHDGTPFDSDDVVATFDRVVNPPEGMVNVFGDWFPTVTAVEAIDSHTVEFQLDRPQATLVPLLGSTSAVIYSSQSLEENDYDLRTVIAPGTGPFVYEEHTDGERWLYSRNENYWNPEIPYVDELELVVVPVFADRGTAVLTGQGDLAGNVARETWEEAQNVDDINTGTTQHYGSYLVFVNNRREPFDDPRVRRAMHLALGRQDLQQVFRSQETIALTRWVPHGDQHALSEEEIGELPAYREDKEADIEEARALLEEAGYGDGFEAELLAASIAPHAELLAPAVQDILLTNLNIDTTIRVTERETMTEEQRAGRYDLNLGTIGNPISDFSVVANNHFKSDGSQNVTGYSNAEFDELLAQSDEELDEDARGELIRQMEDLLDEDPPWLPIGYTTHLQLWWHYVHGWSLEADILKGNYETVWMDEH